MQMISRDKLLKLIKKPDGIREAESGNVFLYEEFLEVSQNELEKASAQYSGDAEYITCEKLRNGWIKDHCPPIRFLGEGSSRLAMAIDGGKCLKIATNDEGISQNENEIRAFDFGQNYSCFPKLYAYDKMTRFSLVVDCCTESKPEDFIRIYGIECNYLVGTLQQLLYDDLDFKKTKQYFIDCINDPKLGEDDEWENFEPRLKFLEKLMVKKDKEMPWTVMWDLAKFCAEYHTLVGLYDLESEVNWE